MTIDFGSIKSYNPDRGFGFVDRSFFAPNRKVFFHIKKIKKEHPELAQKLDNSEAFEAINFWYEVETTEKGEQVSKLWLNTDNIPQTYTHELHGLIEKVERIWKDVYSPKPSWLDPVTIELIGVDRRHELSAERNDLESQLRIADEKRRKRAEAERLRQTEVQLERERQRVEIRNRLETQRQEHIRVAQEKARKVAGQQYLDRKDEIRQMCEEIGVATLIHFTHLRNLKSILQKGLLGRKQLEGMNVKFHSNDEWRLEGKREAICLSISFPNYKMFYKCRCSNPLDANWVVLLLNSSILWEMECKFYIENAASNNARHSDLNGDRSQPLALREMFENYGTLQRTDLRIPSNFTTNPQAEVLVSNPIPVEYIQSVDFCNKYTAECWLNQNNIQEARNIDFYYSDRFFSPRQDWKSWQSISQNTTRMTNLDDDILF